MRLKKKLLQNYSLYVILDRAAARGRDLFTIVSEAIKGGAGIVQLRDKQAEDFQLIDLGKRIRDLTLKYGTIFIVNDRTDIAMELGADGVHLGQQDLSILTARKILGKNKIIGISTHSLEQAKIAQSSDADYISIGPIFSTPTKPTYRPVGLKLIEEARRRLRIPFVAIGGIDQENLNQVLLAGAKTVAVVRAVVSAENPRIAAGRIKKQLLDFKNKYE